MLNWILNIWDKFSMWVGAQPTFVQVACGIALFYVTLQLVKLSYKLIILLVAPLSQTPRRFKRQKDLRPKPRKQKATPSDNDSPPFVFR
jgi:hypothetical protein